MKAKAMRSVAAAAFCLSVLNASPAQAQTDSSAPQDQWHYSGSIYVWGADIGGQTINGSEVEVEFSELFDDLEMAFMGAFEARRNEWSILADVVYMDVSASKTADLSIPIGPIQVPVTTNADVDLTGWLLHFAGGYEWYSDGDSRADLVGGLRYLDLDMDLFLELQSLGPDQSRTVSESIEAWNGFVGIRGRSALGKRWYLPYYVDIGAGESKLTWQASVGIGFEAGQIWDVALLYRHLEWELDSTRVVDDINFSGPTLGVIFRW